MEVYSDRRVQQIRVSDGKEMIYSSKDNDIEPPGVRDAPVRKYPKFDSIRHYGAKRSQKNTRNLEMQEHCEGKTDCLM